MARPLPTTPTPVHHGWRPWRLAAAALLLGALLACGGSGGDSPATEGMAQVGPAGAQVTGAGGAVVEVPAGALATETTVRIAQDAVGAPPLPTGLEAAGAVYSLTPHGITFSELVTVRVPFDASLLGSDREPVLMKAQPGGEWQMLTGARREGSTMVARSEGFSFYLVVICTRSNTVTGSPGCNQIANTYRADLAWSEPSSTNGRFEVSSPRYVNLRLDYTVPRTSYGLQYELFFSRNNVRTVKASGALPASPLTLTVPVTTVDQGSHIVMVRIWCVAEPQLVGPPACTPDVGSTEPVTRPFHALSGHVVLNVNIPTGTSNAALAPMIAAEPQDLEVAVGNPEARFSITSTAPARHLWQESRDGGSTWRDLGSWPIKTAGTNCITPSACLTRTRVPADPALESTLDVVGDLLAPQALTTASNGWLYRVVLQNDFGTALSRAARLSVVAPELPAVQQAPQPLQVLEGQTASFSAVFSGRPAPTVCWERLPLGATTWLSANVCAATYTTGPQTIADNGTQVRAVGRNGAGSTPSAPATLSVVRQAVAPAIVGAPQPVSVPAGATALFAAGVSGTAPLSYQWERNGTAIAGANTPVLSLPGVTPADDGALLRLVVSNSAGSTASDAVRLTVSTVPGASAPVIVTEPADLDVAAGSDATFAVGAVSQDALSFQWLRDGTPIAGATQAAITLRAVGSADAARYAVQVTNALGTVTSRGALLRLTAAVVTAPTLLVQPASVVVAPGGSATLAVAASGSAPLTYAWQRDGVPVPGADQPVLVLTAVDASSAGSYTVTVSNSAGTASSTAAQVLLLGAPAITSQPAAQTVAEGASYGFAVTASGQNLRYQWLKNGLAVAGGTAATLGGTAALADNGSSFQVLVYNGTGLVFSNTAVLTVTPLASWRAATPLQASGDVFDISAGIDDQGRALAVWHDNQRLMAATADGNGAWGTPAAIDNNQFTNGYESRLAVAANGSAIATWGYFAGGTTYRSAAVARTSGGWGTPIDVDGSLIGNSNSARVAIDASGNGVVVWLQAVGSRYEVYGRRLLSGSWQAPVPLDPGIAAGMLSVTLNASGQGVVSYISGGNTELRAVPVDVGAGFSAPQIVRTGASTIGSARVAVDGNGDRWAAWVEGAAVGYDLRVARYTAAGGWAAASTLQTGVGFPLENRFSMAGGAGGHVLIAWTDSQTTNNHTLYARRYDPASGWAAREALSTPGRRYALLPQAAVNASGRMALVWQQGDASGSGDERAGRTFDGSSWTAAQRVQSSTNSLPSVNQMGLGLSANGSAVAVWPENLPSGGVVPVAAFWR